MGEKRFTLRMDEDLYNQISELADRNKRSVAKEMEMAIASYLSKASRFYESSDMDDVNRYLNAGWVHYGRSEREYDNEHILNVILYWPKDSGEPVFPTDPRVKWVD